MATRTIKPLSTKHVETLTHDDAKRKNLPSVEQQSIATQEHIAPKQIRYPRANAGDSDEKDNRNRDLDPQLVWRGKDEQDWSDLVVNAPLFYIDKDITPNCFGNLGIR